MILGATFLLVVTHSKLITDAAALEKVQAITLGDELQFPGVNLTPCYDNSTITNPGEITREVRVPFTADFVAAHSTTAAQTAALTGLLSGPLRRLLPADKVIETLTIGIIVCPPPP